MNNSVDISNGPIWNRQECTTTRAITPGSYSSAMVSEAISARCITADDFAVYRTHHFYADRPWAHCQ